MIIVSSEELQRWGPGFIPDPGLHLRAAYMICLWLHGFSPTHASYERGPRERGCVIQLCRRVPLAIQVCLYHDDWCNLTLCTMTPGNPSHTMPLASCDTPPISPTISPALHLLQQLSSPSAVWGSIHSNVMRHCGLHYIILHGHLLSIINNTGGVREN